MISKIALKPLQVTPLHERVYQELSHALMSGKFEPGRKLTSRKVAAAIGTSDMPVRAALARLVAEGGLVQRPNGTMIVPLVSRAKFRDVMQVRALLEGRATAMASDRIDARGLKQAHHHAERLAAAVQERDIVKYLDHNQRLKFTIYSYCGSPTLNSLIGILWLQAGPFLRSLSAGLEGIMDINYHLQALEALARKDAGAAGEAIARDILEGMEYLLQTAEFAAGTGEEAQPESMLAGAGGAERKAAP